VCVCARALSLKTPALVSHAYARPFDSDQMDIMEFISLCTTFTTFFVGQFLWVPELSTFERAGFSWLIIGVNTHTHTRALVVDRDDERETFAYLCFFFIFLHFF